MSSAAGAGSSSAAAAAAPADASARIAALETKIASLEAKIEAAEKSGDVLSNAALMTHIDGLRNIQGGLQEEKNLLQKQLVASQASGPPAAHLTQCARICANGSVVSPCVRCVGVLCFLASAAASSSGESAMGWREARA